MTERDFFRKFIAALRLCGITKIPLEHHAHIVRFGQSWKTLKHLAESGRLPMLYSCPARGGIWEWDAAIRGNKNRDLTRIVNGSAEITLSLEQAEQLFNSIDVMVGENFKQAAKAF